MNEDFFKKLFERRNQNRIKVKTPKEEQIMHNTKKQYNRRYVVTSYILDNLNLFSYVVDYPQGGRAVDYKRKYFNHLDSAKHSAFLEGLKNRQADVFDLETGEFL